MYAEVIAIGDELTSGQRLDTNSQWISRRLADLGVRVLYHTTAADELEADTEAFRRALDRVDLVVSTGGLGPTADDLTREAIARAAGSDLVRNDEALAHIRRLFARWNREMPERNVVQAMFPRGSSMIPNPNGTAPGIDLLWHRPDRRPVRLFALPGVPAEMRDMWEASVEPAIARWLGPERRFIRHRLIQCFGAGESDIERMLPDLVRRGRVPTVGITASLAGITLRITAEGPSPEACEALIEPTAATIRQSLGELVFGEGEDQLQDVVVQMLKERRHSLATVECDSCGLAAEWLGEADPSGATYRGGIVARQPAIAAQALGLAAEPGQATDSKSMVETMAIECRRRFNADYALAVGPFPRLDADQPRAHHVHLVLAGPEGATVTSVRWAGHPAIRKARTVKHGLNTLRLMLLG